MSPGALVATEPDSLPDIAPVVAGRLSNGAAGGVESWLNDHLIAIALTVTAAGCYCLVRSHRRNLPIRWQPSHCICCPLCDRGRKFPARSYFAPETLGGRLDCNSLNWNAEGVRKSDGGWRHERQSAPNVGDRRHA